MAKVDGLEGLTIVAHSNVFPRPLNNKVHNVELPQDRAKVEIVKVIEQFIGLKVDCPPPPEPDRDTLGSCKGGYISWAK
jgi:hypothetical protein